MTREPRIAVEKKNIQIDNRGWPEVPFKRTLSREKFTVGKVKLADYRIVGRFPIIDQGQQQVAGYWDEERDVYQGPLPIVIFGDHTRVVKFVREPFVCGADGTKVLVPDTDLFDPEFFFYALLNVKLPSRGYNRHFPLLRDMMLPCPPIQDQRAIASVLHAVQQTKVATKGVIAATHELKRSLMRHLFTYGPVPIHEAENVPLKETEIGPIPEHWNTGELRDLADLVQYGTSERCQREPLGAPVLGIPNVVGGRVDVRDIKFLNDSKTNREKLRLSSGDLLFVRTNATRSNIGHCAVYEGYPQGALFASYLLRVRLKPSTVLPELLYYFAWSNAGVRQLSGRASGAADGKFNINSQILKSLVVPLPPLQEQQQVVAILRGIDEKADSEFKRQDALRRVFEALLLTLMTGQHRVVYPEVE